MSAIYEPPYESPLEDIFAWNIIKYLSNSIVLEKQVTLDTICGAFRVDFVVHKRLAKIGLECDGRDYHNPVYDEWRDAILIGSNQLQAVYHFPGRGIFHHVAGCLAALSIWEPTIFSDAGTINLRTLAREVFQDERYVRERRIFVPWPISDPEAATDDQDEPAAQFPDGFDVWRTSWTEEPRIWKIMYDFAEQCGSSRLDDVITRWETTQQDSGA
jgi:hypothetical protein